MSRLQRITSDPAVCHGQPTVRGLRHPVENLLELLSSGMTIDEVLDDYPDVERDELLAAPEFRGSRRGRRPGGPARRRVRFLVDGQLPDRLSRYLNNAGHTDDDKIRRVDLWPQSWPRTALVWCVWCVWCAFERPLISDAA